MCYCYGKPKIKQRNKGIEMLILKNVSKTFTDTDTKILRNVSLELKSGLNFIVGSSGSGKTTLLKMIAGFDQNYDGEIFYNGNPMKEFNNKEKQNYFHNSVGFVWQNFNLLKHLSVADNVKIALTLSDMTEKEKTEKVNKILTELKIIKLANENISKLSGGQKQRVAIARALINDPEIIIADEPTGALDKKTSEVIMNILNNIAKERLVIVVTHDKSLVKEKNNCFLIKEGEISQISTNEKSEEKTKISKEQHKAKFSFSSTINLAMKNFKGHFGKFVLTALVMVLSVFFIVLGTNGSVSNEQEQILDSLIQEKGNQLRDITIPTSAISSVGGDEDEETSLNIEQNVSEVLLQYQNDPRLEYLIPSVSPKDMTVKIDGVIKDYKVPNSNSSAVVKEVVSGRMPTQDNMEIALTQVFLDNNKLTAEDVLGKTMSIAASGYDWTSGEPVLMPIQFDGLTIVGIIDSSMTITRESETFEIEQEDSFIYGLDFAREMKIQTNSDEENISFNMRVKEIGDMMDIVNELRAKGITPLGSFEEVESILKIDESTSVQTDFLSYVMAIVGVIGLVLVAVINAYLRKNEYAVLKSNAFSNSNLFYLNIAESFIITTISALLFFITLPVTNAISLKIINISVTGSAGYSVIVFIIAGVVMSIIGAIIAKGTKIEKHLINGEN